jgi:maleylacetate reductase
MSSKVSVTSSSVSNPGSLKTTLLAAGEQGEFSFLPLEKVYFGAGCLAWLASETKRLGASRVLVITGHTLTAQTPLINRVEAMLGENHRATYSDIRQHAPESGINEALGLAVECQADMLISIGGGSPIDAAKIVAYKLANAQIGGNSKPVYLPHIAVPTTLSAAEFSHVAGYTEEASRSKTGISEARITPRVVILDPELTLWTPMRLWLASGIRSLDHAVETLYSPGNHPINDVLALKAIATLFQFLLLSKDEPENVEFRQECQLAAWMSYFAPASAGAHAGLSHTIGKRIGATYGVLHGVTSCILLAHVMRFKATQAKDAARLAPVGHLLNPGSAAFSDREAALAAADAVEDLVHRLDLPSRLSQAGVPENALEDIARSAGSDESGRAVVMSILRQAW